MGIISDNNSSKSNNIKEHQILQHQILQYHKKKHYQKYEKIPKNIRPVIKLCFVSLVYLCSSSGFDYRHRSRKEKERENSKDSRSSSIIESSFTLFKLMIDIPAKVAHMLWLEILGIDSDEVSCDHNSNAPLSSLNNKGENNEGEEKSYWKYFLTSEERNNFLKYVDSCNN